VRVIDAPSRSASASDAAAGQPRIDRRRGQRRGCAVAGGHGDHGLDTGLRRHLGQRGRGAVEDDDGFAARVLELVLQLARGVQRVHVHLHRAGTQDADADDREGQEVGQHHGDAVAFLHAQALLQPGGKGGRLAVHIGKAQGLAEGPEGGLVGVAAHRVVEQVHHRRPGVGVDGFGDAVVAVGGEPGSGIHDEVSC